MITLNHKDVSGIFLDHQKLIHQAYSGHNKDAVISNILFKDYIFIYKKDQNTEVLENIKRKRRKFYEIPQLLLENHKEIQNEINMIQNGLNTLRNILKEHYIKEDNHHDTINKNESFEEIFDKQNFPKFRGENPTKSTIICNFNGNRYLIPPECTFLNYNINEISNIEPSLSKFDLIVMDPPWRNKFIRRVKKFKAEYAYNMLSSDEIANIPIENLSHNNSLICIWCTNSPTHQKTIVKELFPKWHLKLLKKLFWIKLNENGDTVCQFANPGQKQPYEVIYIAIHQECEEKNNFLDNIEFIFSTPSIIHSHKPPLFDVFKKFLPTNPKCLEIFARYLYPNFTSIGLEVLKLMDERLYNCT